jgi:hypothetical protein
MRSMGLSHRREGRRRRHGWDGLKRDGGARMARMGSDGLVSGV